MKKLIILCLLLQACAGHRPLVYDAPTTYESDLEKCRAHAAEVYPVRETTMKTGISAIIGGIIGALIGVVLEYPGELAAYGAGVFAVSDGLVNVAQIDANRAGVVRECMKTKGHVLVE